MTGFAFFFRINPRAFEDAFITSTEYNDIFISGVMHRNRALHGDEVAVDLFPEAEWRVLHDQVAAHIEDNLAEMKIDQYNVEKEVSCSLVI